MGLLTTMLGLLIRVQWQQENCENVLTMLVIIDPWRLRWAAGFGGGGDEKAMKRHKMAHEYSRANIRDTHSMAITLTEDSIWQEMRAS